jgi:hypothetical protein
MRILHRPGSPALLESAQAVRPASDVMLWVSMGEEQLPISELNTDDAALLGDLGLVVQDLRSVKELCRRLAGELDREPKDAVQIEALWTAALVKYVRCFSSGKRFGVKQDIFSGLDGDPIGAHKYFKNLRDKHVAHSVNPFERVRVGVLLSAPSVQPQIVEGVAVLSRSLISTSREGAETLWRLATAAEMRIADQAKELQGRIVEWAKQQPIEDFLIGSLEIGTPGEEDAASARS